MLLLRLSRLYHKICNKKNYILHYILILLCKIKLETYKNSDHTIRIYVLEEVFYYLYLRIDRNSVQLHNQNKFFDFVYSNRLINFARIIINHLCNDDKIFMNNAIISYQQI